MMILLPFALLLLLWVGACLYFYARQGRLIYDTTPDHPVMTRASVYPGQVVTLSPEAGIENECWYWPAKPGQGNILFCHGNNLTIEVRTAWMQFAIARGWGLLMVGYRGYGGNPGTPSQPGLTADALAAYDYLVDQGVDDIHLLGHSLGSGVASQIAAQRPCKSLGLLSPFNTLIHAAWDLYPFLPTQWILRDHWRSRDVIGQINCPLMIVACDRDTTVRYARSQQLFAAAKAPKEFLTIPGIDHGDISLQGGPKALVDFFERVG